MPMQGMDDLGAVIGCQAVRALDVLQDAADRGAVQSVQVKGPSTSWQDLDNVWGASWEASQVPEGPLDLHSYDDLGVDVGY